MLKPAPQKCVLCQLVVSVSKLKVVSGKKMLDIVLFLRKSQRF